MTSSSTPAPDLTVVVIVLEGPNRLRSCLNGLRRQESAPAMEIIVPWDGTHGDSHSLQAEFPEAAFLSRTGPRTYAQLRAVGVAQARGPIIAITEDHCTPDPNWAAAIFESHKSPHAAIGGAVEKKSPDTALNWSFYLADYLRYSDPQDGPSDHLTDCNVTYKRSAIEPLRNVWREEFHENTVHAALRARGESLWLSPRIIVWQKRHLSLGPAIWDRYAFGRLFGSTRVTGASPITRLKYSVSSALLPLLLMVRVTGHIARNTRYAGPFLRSLPVLILINTVWAFGEFTGYLTGRPEQRLKAREA